MQLSKYYSFVGIRTHVAIRMSVSIRLGKYNAGVYFRDLCKRLLLPTVDNLRNFFITSMMEILSFFQELWQSWYDSD